VARRPAPLRPASPRMAPLRAAMLRPAAAAIAAVILAGGCAAVPTVGRPEPVTGAGAQAQQFVQPIPPVPTAAWTASEIVRGFVAASASVANNPAAARRFLAPQLRKNFQPSWAVTVVGSVSLSSEGRAGPAHVQGAPNDVATVYLSGNQLASISNIGQYLDNPGAHRYKFKLAKINDQWFITYLPPTSLLLTQANFEEVYQPRNLYFWSPDWGALVPEPVFAPQQETYADVATNLVNALLKTNQDNSTWLAGATTTAFPDGSALIGKVRVVGPSMVVNLGGAAASADPTALQRMAAQLVTTLTSTSYLQPSISRSVILEINGQTRSIDDNGVQEPQHYSGLVPGFRPGAAPLYFVNTAGAVSVLTGAAKVTAVPGPVAHVQIPFATIAVSPPTTPAQFAGTAATGTGCTVYYGPIGGSAPLAHRELPGRPGDRCTSLSWDVLGEVWAVTAHQTWVLPPGGEQPVTVSLPPLPGRDPPSYQVLALRVAPDGVRAAMLVRTHSGAHQVVLTAITRSGGQISLGPTVTVGTNLHDPITAVSWYDADHLIVLAGSQLYEVPANGGNAVPIGPVQPGTTSIASAGRGKIATAGGGQILTSSGPDQVQLPAVKGSSPAYPG
jgi:hypothetical protein